MPPPATILPPNSTGLELAADLMMASRIDGLPAPLRPLWSAADCPPDLLPWLAWALSIDQWDPAWPLATRRARVAAAIAVQRRKGTVDSVRRVTASFGSAISLLEWWQQSPPGAPHTFAVEAAMPSGTGGAAPSASLIDAVIAEIEATKPLRSHFTFTLAENAVGAIGLRAAARPVVYARLALTSPASIYDPDTANNLTLGGDPLTLGGEILTLGA